MSLSAEELEKLQGYQTMMGPEAGNLALAMDQLTDIMAGIAKHRMYCRIERGPRAGEGTLDIEELLATIEKTKDLVRAALAALQSKPI